MLAAGDRESSLSWATESMSTSVAQKFNYVTPVAPFVPTVTTSVLITPPTATDDISDLFPHLNPTKTITAPKLDKILKSHEFNVKPIKSTDSSKENVANFKYDNNIKPINIGHKNINNVYQKAVIPILENHNELNNLKHNTFKPILENNIKNIPLVINYGDMSTEKYILTNKKNYKIASVPNPSISVHNKHFNEEFVGPSLTTKRPIIYKEKQNYFIPDYSKSSLLQYLNNTQFSTKRIQPHRNMPVYFKPNLNMSLNKINLPHSKPIILPNTISTKSMAQNIHSSLGKHITVMRAKDFPLMKGDKNYDTSCSESRSSEQKSLILTKDPNPYKTVLLRPVPHTNLEVDKDRKYNRITDSYSALDLSRFLNQLEIETEVNTKLGRSAERARNVGPRSGQCQT